MHALVACRLASVSAVDLLSRYRQIDLKGGARSQATCTDALSICHCRHKSQATPYWFHAVMVGFITSMPLSLINGYVMREHQRFRSLWYKKQERTQKKAM